MTKEAAREEAYRKALAVACEGNERPDTQAISIAVNLGYDAGYESARDQWTAFDWDDASKQPSESGWYLCRDPYPGESQPVVCDQWNGSEFVHYGVYGAWMPIPDFKEANDDQ